MITEPGRIKSAFRQASLLLFLCISALIKAQELPPRPIRIDLVQNLSFGAFYQGPTGGTITIDPSGSRSATGDIIPLNLGYLYFPAMFEVHAHPGTVLSILNGPPTTLTGTPSGSMTMQVGASIPASPFVSTVHFNIAIPLYIGGILNVGSPAANPPGSYTGTFDITLVRE